VADLVRQRQALLARIRLLRLDAALGMLSSELATWFIIFTTGAVLHTHGITTITTADQAAASLDREQYARPLLARATRYAAGGGGCHGRCAWAVDLRSSARNWIVAGP
jgi:hypothetical protein